MLEKLAMHEVESITTLFSLADKCARAAEGRTWHSAPQDGDAKTGGSGATSQGGGTSYCGSGWWTECAWQMPTPARWQRRFMPSASHLSPQHR